MEVTLKTTVILLGHGSQAEGGNEGLAEVAALVSERGGVDVRPAYLQFCSPSLTEAVEKAIGEGAGRIVVAPYFLYMGNHVARDIPEELDGIRALHPGVEMVMSAHLGMHPKLAEIVLERIRPCI
jgi:sirohydrochlorin ferrochelatase